MEKETEILVIDDEPSVGDALKMILEDNGYKVCVEMLGRQGIKRAREHEFDVLIIDLCLPDMNGFEVLGEVRHVSPQSNMIMITSHATSEVDAEATRCGAAKVLSKPFSPSDILNLIKTLEADQKLFETKFQSAN